MKTKRQTQTNQQGERSSERGQAGLVVGARGKQGSVTTQSIARRGLSLTSAFYHYGSSVKKKLDSRLQRRVSIAGIRDIAGTRTTSKVGTLNTRETQVLL